MQTFVQFIVDYWQYISVALVVLLNILLLLLKRKPKIYGYALRLIDYITEAEKLYGSGHGDEKLEYVVQKECDHEKMVDNSFNRKTISYLVDKVLNTPTKKGGLGRGEK